jgi:photoactive yellow protein
LTGTAIRRRLPPVPDDLLGVGTTSIKRWADDGTLPCVKTAGGHRRFLRSEVLRLLAVGTEPPGHASPPPELLGRLASMTEAQLDALQLGVVQLDDEGGVLQYNSFEETFAERRRDDVKGRNFFTEVAPCTNNSLLREPFLQGVDSGELDLEIDYAFTYKMALRAVSLRLFRDPLTATNWLLVRPR